VRLNRPNAWALGRLGYKNSGTAIVKFQGGCVMKRFIAALLTVLFVGTGVAMADTTAAAPAAAAPAAAAKPAVKKAKKAKKAKKVAAAKPAAAAPAAAAPAAK